MEKYDKFFRDKCPCSRTNMQIFEKDSVEEGLPRTIFASVNYLSSALVKENLSSFPFTLPSRKTCQGELASVYTDSRQFFLDKETFQGK